MNSNATKTVLKSRVLPFAGGCIAGFLALLSLIALVVWGIVGAVTDLDSDGAHFPGYTAFDSALWLEQEQTERSSYWPPRLLMVDNLLKSQQLSGLTREQVLTLLGQPDGTELDPLGDESSIHYYLGPERGPIRIDSEWLDVSFSEEDVVSRAWLSTD